MSKQTQKTARNADFSPADDNMSRMIHAAPIGICVTDRIGHFVMVNKAYCSFYGYSEKELLGQHFSMVTTDANREVLSALHDKFMQGSENHELSQEWQVRHRDGSYLTILAYATLIYGKDEKPYKVTYVNDITQRKTLEKRLKYLAHHDEMTGLLNRWAGLKYLQKERKRCERYTTPLCIAIFDIDHFKAINDTYGHGAGDSVLVEMCTLLNDSVRETDTLARLGGEEFLLVMPGINLDDAFETLDRLRHKVNTKRFADERLTVSFSAGVAQCQCDSEDAENLVKRADRALYQAKEGGRNRVCKA
ncbi:GGDEF domain-containing protein [Halomonas sp. LS-001]